MVGGLFLPASQLALRAWWPPNLGDWAFDNATESKNKQGLSVMNTQDTQDTCYEEVDRSNAPPGQAMVSKSPLPAED